uniref:CYGN protein n=1 Tax=Nothoprocta perdicaria TaxID=30464 RepID=A0A8C6ZDJ3_NOTPE
MRFLYLIFAVFLLVSLAAPGYASGKLPCPKEGVCASACAKGYSWNLASNCKEYCCIPLAKKWK